MVAPAPKTAVPAAIILLQSICSSDVGFGGERWRLVHWAGGTEAENAGSAFNTILVAVVALIFRNRNPAIW